MTNITLEQANKLVFKDGNEIKKIMDALNEAGHNMGFCEKTQKLLKDGNKIFGKDVIWTNFVLHKCYLILIQIIW